MITLIAALSENNCIGNKGTIPWRLPGEQKHFKELSIGRVVIMGRKTWESLPPKFRPLPDRTNVVITRQTDFELPEGVFRFSSLEEALKNFDGQDIAIAGGAEIYRAALPFADRLELTRVHQTVDGDTFFPDFSSSEWKEVKHEAQDGYTFYTYDRIPLHHD